MERQRKVNKTRDEDLANLGTESEVIALRDFLKEALKLLMIALTCLLLALLALLIK